MYLSKHQIGIFAIIVNTLIWSAASPIMKWSLHDALPFAFAFYRFLIATFIMLPIVINKIKISIDDFYKILTLSFIGLTANIIFYYFGLSLAPSINFPIISSTTPLFLLIAAFFFLHERPRAKHIIGTIVSFIGVLIIVALPVIQSGKFGSMIGNFYYLLSILMLVIYTILFKKFKLKYSYTTLIFWMFLLATLTLFPLYLIELLKTSFMSSFHFRGMVGILYGGLFSSTVGYFLYNYGAKHIRASELGIFVLLEPVATALVAIPLLGEKITFSYLLGSIIVFMGIFIAEAKLRYHPSNHFYKNLKNEEVMTTPLPKKEPMLGNRTD